MTAPAEHASTIQAAVTELDAQGVLTPTLRAYLDGAIEGLRLASTHRS